MILMGAIKLTREILVIQTSILKSFTKANDIKEIETLILSRLHAFRIRGSSNRPNELLQGISASEVEKMATEAIKASTLD